MFWIFAQDFCLSKPFFLPLALVVDNGNFFQSPLTQCKNCPAPFTNKPIIGLNILQNFKADPAQPNHFIDGMVLDPRAGKIYHGKARLNANGNKLTLRGYIGISLIGRSQTWIRQK